MKLQRSKVKSKQLFYLHLNKNNNNGIVSTYFLDRFARSVYTIKDVRGWQFLTMKAAETWCIVCLQPENIFPEKNIW